MSNYKEERPWGTFENLLDTDYCKVKEIVIKKGGRPSYQYHHKRSEVWVVVEGQAVVTLDDKEYTYKVGEVVNVPVGTKHRVENREEKDLKFIEVQVGTYFGEDDIVRLEDDYGREGTNV
jgi:mannose-6-phosphate isomerase-like protein (cupin superfamily)|tara:strand:+ start:144 stop:503 length:360 start_codon:yes stop_codon:yes gene_type:complete